MTNSLIDTGRAVARRVLHPNRFVGSTYLHERDINGHPFYYRPESEDLGVYSAVYEENEYELPGAFDSDDVILDVGAHVGSFSLACAARGAGKIIAFEAHPENYAIARKNLAPYPNVELHPLAAWRSDGGETTLSMGHFSEQTTGVGSLLLADGAQVEVKAVPFDSFLTGSVTLLKCDVEGSEYPILYTSKRLHLVREIRGEYHELSSEEIPEHAKVEGAPPFTGPGLKSFLEGQGFKVTLKPYRETLGLFFASR